MKSELSMIIFAVKDLSESRKFYESIFEWPISVDVPVAVSYIAAANVELMLYQIDSFTNNTIVRPVTITDHSITGTELYIHAQDLDDIISRMENAGARLLSSRSLKPWGDEAAYYADPDDNVIVVAKPVDHV